MAKPRQRSAQSGSVPFISASEIGEYGYCSRAWWYRHVVKLQPPQGYGTRFEAGTRAHSRHSRWVRSSLRLRSAALLLILLGLALLAVAFALAR